MFLLLLFHLGIEFSLVGGDFPTIGRVQFTIDNFTGSICGDTFFDDAEANIICKQLNFTGGRRLSKSFGTADGSLFITSLRCQGNESKITDCQLVIDKSGDTVHYDRGDNSIRSRSDWYGAYRRSNCWMGKEDAAVQCYKSGWNNGGCAYQSSAPTYSLYQAPEI